MSSGAEMSWRACRAFLTDLAAHAEAARRGDPVPHVRDCPRCAGLLRSTAAQQDLLRDLVAPALPPQLADEEFLARIHERVLGHYQERITARLSTLEPAVPDALERPEFLTAIYERAGEASRRRVGPALERSLTPVRAPADADWLAREDAEEVAESLVRALPSGAPPGWLWTRIRAEIRDLVLRRRRARLHRRARTVGLLAASLLLSVLALRVFLVPLGDRTADPEIRFAPLEVPLDVGLSPVAAIRRVGVDR